MTNFRGWVHYKVVLEDNSNPGLGWVTKTTKCCLEKEEERKVFMFSEMLEPEY
jgi:hypothetical protein